MRTVNRSCGHPVTCPHISTTVGRSETWLFRIQSFIVLQPTGYKRPRCLLCETQISRNGGQPQKCTECHLQIFLCLTTALDLYQLHVELQLFCSWSREDDHMRGKHPQNPTHKPASHRFVHERHRLRRFGYSLPTSGYIRYGIHRGV